MVIVWVHTRPLSILFFPIFIPRPLSLLLISITPRYFLSLNIYTCLFVDVFNLHVEFNCVVIVLSHNTLRFIHVTMICLVHHFCCRKLLGIEKTASQYQKAFMNIPHTCSLLFLAIFSHGDSFKIKCGWNFHGGPEAKILYTSRLSAQFKPC